MISVIEPTAGKNRAPICVLKVVLLGAKPTIWRRLQVPGNANLGWLHAALQVAMGWTNSHLHQFRIGDQVCSDPSFQLDEYEGDPPVLDENRATVMSAAPRKKDAFGYEYDFGDSWAHKITVEKILPPDPAAATTALCLDGARACPPEDCGGIWGYAELLKTLKNPKHPEHRRMKKWLGRPLDAEAFDIAKTNLWLRKLKWPHVTEGQLRKVLMGRDGYHG